MKKSLGLALKAARMRDGIIHGYRDLAAGNTVDFHGDLHSLLETGKSCQQPLEPRIRSEDPTRETEA